MSDTSTQLLHDEVVWVTGASRGAGRAIAHRLAEAGATVILGARDEESMRQSEEILAARGKRAIGLPLDLTDHASIDRFAVTAMEREGAPTILVNNAGVGLFRDFLDMPTEEFERELRVNLQGPMRLTQLAARRMKLAGEGRILFVSSIAGTHAFKRGSAYCPTKAGLNSFAETLMLELREYGIVVSTIAPGSIRTGFHQQALPSAHHNDQEWMLSPEEIAESSLHILTQPRHLIVSYYEVRPLRTGSK